MQTRSMKLKERVISGTVLQKLPAELLDIIATNTDNKGLKSMRATCRELRDGSAFEFLRRHTTLEIRLTGTRSGRFSSEFLIVATMSPDVAKAQAMIQGLALQKSSTALHVSPQNMESLRERVSRDDVKMLLSRLVSNDFELKQMSLLPPKTASGVTPHLLKRIAALAPETLKLRKLALEDLDFCGDDLINLLETHHRNLQHVFLSEVVLTKTLECMVALSSLEAQNIKLKDIKIRDDSGNSRDLTAQSPELLELLRRLQQRDPDWNMLDYGTFPRHAFSFRKESWG